METAPARIKHPAHIAPFCRRWHIAEMSLFGSVLRGDFRPDSDIDVLIEFEPGATAGLFEWAQMEGELRFILGREVDVVEKAGLRNPYRRRAILGTHQVIYAA
jgi:predicted nucleotidyltransferase